MRPVDGCRAARHLTTQQELRQTSQGKSKKHATGSHQAGGSAKDVKGEQDERRRGR